MKNGFVLLLALFTSMLAVAGTDSLTTYVNPFIGTGGHGHTYPGASMPFGMVQLSPDTRLEGWDGCSGYHYSDSIIYGFSHTHLSGTGVSDYGDVLFMPVSGEPALDNGRENHQKGYASRFSHSREEASPGYYHVYLDDYNIAVDLTVSKRAGFHSYTFHDNKQHHVILDLEHRDKVRDNQLVIINDSTIAGKRISSAWAQQQHIYFYTVFSRPFSAFTTNQPATDSLFAGEEGIVAAFSFKDADRVMLKTGISAVDMAGAKKNLEKEIPHWNFAQTKAAAEKEWKNELKKILAEGGTEKQKTNFYTALYHTFLHPNIYNDVDGRYRGRDMKIYQLGPGEEHYTVFSLWDTFRALHPLFTILQKERTKHFINTMLRQYRQGGRLPVWELAANETDCMIGYHAVPVIADAFLKGLDDFDEELALEAMVNSAMEDRYGLEAYKKNGFIPAENEGESVSKTLEYAYDDWCIARMAEKMEKPAIHKTFTKRAQSWKNIYDPQSRFMRAKTHGHWFHPFDPAEVNYHYTEANAWQYNFFVPQDIRTMIGWMGGDEAFDAFLTDLFTTSSKTSGRNQADITGLIGQYAHGNEPSHHMAYLFSYAKKPWKTQKRVRQILETMYTAEPDGLSGNEDCGQMSAWYVFSAMGFYPVTPADSFYVLGAPVFEKITLKAGEDPFIIEADHPQKPYVKRLTMNQKPWRDAFISHEKIMQGGQLRFQMQEHPDREWFQGFPEREIRQHLVVPVPFAEAGKRSFYDQTAVGLGCADEEAGIFYAFSEEDSAFERFIEPLIIDSSGVLYAYSKKGERKSPVTKMAFNRMPRGVDIELHSAYANQYGAGGDRALIDGLKGGKDYRTGTWQGFQGQNLSLVIDRGENSRIKEIRAGFLQDTRSWIILPDYVEFSFSKDGKHFSEPVRIDNAHPVDTDTPLVKRFEAHPEIKAQYVKVFAKSAGKLPEWHPGAGGDSWIFVDEIEIQ